MQPQEWTLSNEKLPAPSPGYRWTRWNKFLGSPQYMMLHNQSRKTEGKTKSEPLLTLHNSSIVSSPSGCWGNATNSIICSVPCIIIERWIRKRIKRSNWSPHFPQRLSTKSEERSHFLVSRGTPWYNIDEWATPRRTGSLAVKGWNRRLQSAKPVAAPTEGRGGSSMVKLLRRWLSQSAQRIVWVLWHKIRRLWYCTDMSRMQIIWKLSHLSMRERLHWGKSSKVQQNKRQEIPHILEFNRPSNSQVTFINS